jgi:hypothetical protein
MSMNQEQFELGCGAIVILAYAVPFIILILIAMF